MTLWFLATGADYRTVGHLFGVSKSSVCLISIICKEVCAKIVSVLLPQYVKFPTGSALSVVVDGFKNQLGFPQCVGAVDGSHIPIVSPHVCPADYYKPKGLAFYCFTGNGGFSRTVYRFVCWLAWSCTRRPSLFKLKLCSKGQSKTLLPNKPVTLGGTDVPLVIL